MSNVPFGQFVQPQQFVEMFTKASAAEFARIEEMQKQFEDAQKKALVRAFEAIDESARLMKESLGYAVKLSDEWRKITVENTKKAAATVQKATESAEASA